MSPAPGAAVMLSPRAGEVFGELWSSVFGGGPGSPGSVLVCSAGVGEGATTVACGLALAGAAAGSRVALADLNVRRPGVGGALRLSETDGDGVRAVLAGRAEPSEAARRLGPHGLDVLPVGPADGAQRAPDAERAGALLDDLRRRYERVVVDAAPVNPHPDAGLLAGLVDGVVLVARCGRTPREALGRARRRLDAAGARVLGVVLNGRTYPLPAALYDRL